MKFEAPLYDLPKDKHVFFDDEEEVLYDNLPIIVINERNGQCELVDYGNWGDWLSDLSKPCYTHYIRVSDIKLVKEN